MERGRGFDCLRILGGFGAVPKICDGFGSGLRGDLVVDGRYQRGWKDLALDAGVGLN